MSVRSAWLLAAALVLVPLSGCGGSSSADDGGASAGTALDSGGGDTGDAGDSGGGKAGDCRMLSGPTVCFHFDLTGQVAASGTKEGNVGTNNGTSYDTCADWTKGENSGSDDGPALWLPMGGPMEPGDQFGGLSGDVIENYHGPGTYTGDDLSGSGSPWGVITPGVPDAHVLGGTGSTATVTINPDGSGSATFADLGPSNQDSGPTKLVDGKVTWTCHNP